MAHEIDMTTGKAAMAYVGDTPWHGLGQALTPDADIDTWRVQAGLDWEVKRLPVTYGEHLYEGKDVLFRSDTQAPLSVVSDQYRIVQPADVLDFFGELSQVNGFTLETAGSLFGGRRIWGLAKVHDGAPIIGEDVVRPYVLLSTSFDGTLATTAKFTTVRVVCNNTLSMAYRGKSGVKVNHAATFDSTKVKADLGIVADVFDRWSLTAKRLAETPMSLDEASDFTVELLADQTNVKDIRKSKDYLRVMDAFDHGIGSDLTGGFTRWRMLNAVTEVVDHQVGRSVNNRLASAWFGNGANLKDRAFDRLAA